MTRRSLFAGLLALALVPKGATAQAIDGEAAFEKLKGLSGTWAGPVGMATGPKGAIRYEVISAESVVMDVAKDMHVHNGEIRFLNDGRIEANCTAWAGGKPAGSNHFFALSREK